MIEDYVYTGSEASLEGLLLWWGKLEPFKHAKDCDGYPTAIHCCFGVVTEPLCYYAVEATSPPWPKPDEFFPIIFNDIREGFKVRIDSPQRFKYDGTKMWVENA